MGIDGIGKGGSKIPPEATGGLSGASSVTKTGATFSVEETEPTTKATAAGVVDATSPLARLLAGEVDVNGYVDLKVDEATRSLDGLPASDLADLKIMLRDQMATDPGLVELVHKATGSVPTPPED